MTVETMVLDGERRDQFCELIERHRGIVLKVANTYCRDPHDRDDLAQEIISQLWCAFPGYDPARRFSTWMYRIALNVAISQLRYRSRRPVVPLDDAHYELPGDEDVDAETAQRVELLYRFIDSLDPMNRALLLLYLEEKSQAEIAEILGISETNVSTKISRLKQRMKTKFAEAGNGKQ